MQEVFENIIKGLEEKRDEAEKNMELSDVLSEVNSYGGMFDALDKAIEIINQTAAEYNNGWIPCSDRLPEKYGDYLVAWKPLHMSSEDIIKKVGREVPHFYEIVEYNPDDEALWIGGIEQAQGEYEIIAWQPLPQPYQPKGE